MLAKNIIPNFLKNLIKNFLNRISKSKNLIKVKVHNNDRIKLQGVSYYLDNYSFWDLNKCEQNFNSKKYYEMIHSVSNSKSRLYNGFEEMAVIDLQLYKNKYENYQNNLSKNVIRDIKKSEKNKFYFKEFDFNLHIDDFLEINKSQNKKKNKINDWYLNDRDFFLGSHTKNKHYWEDELHYGQWYGLFKYYKNYKQRDVTTNEKLFGYCKLLFDGEMASIGLIWCHADHLKSGLMFHLITSLINECMKKENIKYLVYYGHGQYPQWKNRILFRPRTLKIIM
tara:strand:- start:12855 stop:13697 length:843 start_codon:yes stop_codon:yes gene_type:complete